MLRNARWRLGGVLVAAAALATVLIVASRISAGRATANEPVAASAPTQAPAARDPSLFRGIEQHGSALGSPNAPLTLVEYADLQCPYCARWALSTLPTLVRDYVRTGQLRIVFRGLAFIGPDSDKALRTAVAAGERNRLWELVHGLYSNQGAENAGWVTDELVTEIAANVPGLDGGELLQARWGRSVDPKLRRAALAAGQAGVRGTPAFALGRTGGPLELIEVGSLGPEGILPLIDAALAA